MQVLEIGAIMKECPKCRYLHEKPGKFCSRRCANSRVQTEEANSRRRSKLLGRKTGRRPSSEAQAKMVRGWQEYSEKKYKNSSFEDLSWEQKKRRVLEEQGGKCNRCGLDSWMGEPLVLEVDHTDGIRDNNCRENLCGLCPNCHSLTPTWRGKNKSKKKISDEEIYRCLMKSESTHQALERLGLSPRGGNYKRIRRVKAKYNLI